MKYGYARVSTDDQTPALQLAALKKVGCKTVFKDEGLSGATTKRPALVRCLKKLAAADTLIVWTLDYTKRAHHLLISPRKNLRVAIDERQSGGVCQLVENRRGDISASSAVNRYSLNCLLRSFQLRFGLRHVVAPIDTAQHDLTAAQQSV